MAKDAGILDYALFQNAGYRGLYNLDLARLRELKRVPAARSPLDFMGKEELAANLFRITQTEAKSLFENSTETPREGTRPTENRPIWPFL